MKTLVNCKLFLLALASDFNKKITIFLCCKCNIYKSLVYFLIYMEVNNGKGSNNMEKS